MKPNRILPKPDQPHFTVIRKNDAIEKVPEWRLERLLGTKRFQVFLSEHSDWLTPEGSQNLSDRKVISGKNEIRPERIEEEPANEREKREFDSKMEEAKQDKTGKKAFEYYSEYEQLSKKVMIEDEDAALQFLRFSASMHYDSARKIVEQLQAKEERRSSSCSPDLLSLVNGKNIPEPKKVVQFIQRAKCLKVTTAQCGEFACLGSQDFLKSWLHRMEMQEKLCGIPCEVNSQFSEKLYRYYSRNNYKPGFIGNLRMEVYSLFNKFNPTESAELSNSDVVGLVTFFLSCAKDRECKHGNSRDIGCVCEQELGLQARDL